MMDPYRFVERTLYQLKHKLPSTLVVKKVGPGTVDWETGNVSRESQDFEVRAVALPKTLESRRQPNTGPFSSTLSESERAFLIDAAELKGEFTFVPGDEVLYLGRTWTVSKATQHEGKYYELIVKEIST